MPRLKTRGPVDVLKLVDTRKERSAWREEIADVRYCMRWFARAVKLYGRRTVERHLEEQMSWLRPAERASWRAYFGRYFDGRNRHLVPVGLLLDANYPLGIAERLAVAPRVA